MQEENVVLAEEKDSPLAEVGLPIAMKTVVVQRL